MFHLLLDQLLLNENILIIFGDFYNLFAAIFVEIIFDGLRADRVDCKKLKRRRYLKRMSTE